ncbi:MAG: PAS domain S-box protein [Proteobacteria bacterium]|nr:PAS domain S-box protein [Pseudomonadota bacterium]
MASEKQIHGLAEKIIDLEHQLAGLRRSETRLQKMVANLGTRNEYLLTLHDLCTGLINRSDLDDLLNTIVRHACILVGLPDGFMHLFDPGTRELELKIGTGYFKKAVGFRFKPDRGMGGIAFSTQKPLVVKDYQTWEGRIDIKAFSQMRACVVIPLANRTGTIGLGRFGKDTTGFSRAEVAVLKRFSHMASICIENAKINSDLQQELAQRKRAEKSLAVSEKEFEAVFESVGEGFYRTDAQGRIIMANPVAVKMMGYTSLDEARGISMIDLYNNPDDRRVLLEQIFAQGRVSAYEVEMKKKDGQVIPVMVNAHVRHDANGQFIGIQGTVVDITHRKYQEMETAHSQKLAAIGSLAAGIAHEINTPIQYISDNTHFIQDAFQDFNQVLDAGSCFLETIKFQERNNEAAAAFEAAMDKIDLDFLRQEIPQAILQSLDGLAKVSRIVKSMKEFSHPGQEKWERIDINHVLDNTLVVAKNEYKYVAQMKTDFQASLPKVFCNSGELGQVFLNMIINASHAIADVVGNGTKAMGVITIKTRARGHWVEIRISDTGSGIPKKIQSHIFDPFFTTKEVGRGTGQGLAISHAVVVDKHRGKIGIESSSAKGTTFIIRLPVNGRETKPRI